MAREEKVQVNVYVPKRIKERAQQEADLAAEYGWIPAPHITQLFIWVVDKHLPEVIERHIEERRASVTKED